MRTPLVMGNWKMNLTHEEGARLVAELLEELDSLGKGRTVEVAICPPFTALASVAEVLSDQRDRIQLGAQNVHWETSGAYTGEVSAAMLSAFNCRYVIVGHSERRTLFGESDTQVAAKAKAAMEAGLVPVVCVGESLSERQSDQAEAVVKRQLDAVLDALDPHPFVIAYEPLWAIGTGEAAAPEDAQAVASFLRETLQRAVPEMAGKIRILYGGSVQADNAGAFFAQPDIDGALVGGASLQANSFAGIVQAAGSN